MKKQQIRKHYTIEIDESSMLESITIEEIEGMGRWVYKRNPMKMELPITDDILKEVLMAVLFENGLNVLEQLYVDLRRYDPEYAQKSRKIFKDFLKKCAKSTIGQDALWGE